MLPILGFGCVWPHADLICRRTGFGGFGSNPWRTFHATLLADTQTMLTLHHRKACALVVTGWLWWRAMGEPVSEERGESHELQVRSRPDGADTA